MIVMGIESSCDETGVGIVRWHEDGTCELLADEVASSVDQHARYGGVVPEVASRAHLEGSFRPCGGPWRRRGSRSRTPSR